MTVIARFALREAVRRRVFVVVALLTAAFLVLFGLGVWQAFEISGVSGFDGATGQVVIGATMLGLAMFATSFLGVILAVFLTLGAIRGDAERGLLQPLLVRPISRRDLLLGRFIAAGGVSALYVAAVYCAAVLITGTIGGFWPGDPVTPALGLMAAVLIVTALALAGSVVLASTANGIAVFMAFGAGLVSGLLGQIADVFGSDTLALVADAAGYALPFEALYQHALAQLTSGTSGAGRFVLQLGPLGGAADGGLGVWLWSAAYLGLVLAAALWAFRRRDL